MSCFIHRKQFADGRKPVLADSPGRTSATRCANWQTKSLYRCCEFGRGYQSGGRLWRASSPI